MLEYEFNVPAHLVRSNLVDCFPQKFRSYKYALRKRYLIGRTKDEALAMCPIGNPAIWIGFVSNEFLENISKRRTRNAENRKKKKICHTLGRCSYANKNYNLEKKEGIVTDGRAESWMKGHERKDGTIHPSAVEKYEEVKAAVEKRKNMSGEGSSSQVDLDNDEIAEVFGPDSDNGSMRAYSSCVSKKRAKQALLASHLIEGAEKCNAPLEAKMDKFESRVEGWMKIVMEQLQSWATTETIIEDSTHSPKVGSNSAHGISEKNVAPKEGAVSADISSSSRISETKYVNLLNRNGDCVASGYIVLGKEGETCHSRKVLHGEKKVRIEVVHDVSAAVPDPPQGDGHFTLRGFSEGGWLIWSESRLQYKS